MADPTLSTLQRACRDSWRAGYQAAVDTLRDIAREYGAEDMKLTIAALADALQSVKPGEETADG